jgi:Xaa-Pro dipeptidase
MKELSFDLLIATPGTNFQYFVGYNPGRSERLIALLIPGQGNPLIVSPSFEKERIIRRSLITEVETWEEHENPYKLTANVIERLKLSASTIGMEPTTNYVDYLRLKEELPRANVVDGSPVFNELRMAKSPEELAAIRKAVEITLASISATHRQLKEGVSEQEVAGILSREMSTRGSRGGGLVQFGPSSALPHGGPTGVKLAKCTVVLIDAGCSVDGYTSDITRTIFWGGETTPRFRDVYNTVFEAQQAAAEIAKPGVECQQLDRTARAIIERAGYGKYFTHRLGHGMGMDGHEYPYLVEGNAYKLKPGQVVTIEPGIYMLGEFGVRIEDDFVITDTGVEQISAKVSKI